MSDFVEKLSARVETLEAVIRKAAETCERWADESRRGGWSTHQVEANRALAAKLRSALKENKSGADLSTKAP